MADPAPKKLTKPANPKSAQPAAKVISPAKQGSSKKSSSKLRSSSSSKSGAKPANGKPAGKPKKRAKERGPVMLFLTWPFRAIAQLLLSDVKLKREGKNLNVKLIQKDAPVRAPVVTKEQKELDAMRLALKILLDSHPATRRVMRHLVFVEAALIEKGLKAVNELPIEVLTEAVTQFEALVTNWSSRSLSELRSKMAVAVVDRNKDPFYGKNDKVSEFNTDSRLQVEEDDLSHSRFMEIADAFHGREPNKADPIAKRDLIDFAATEPFERDALQLLSKDFVADPVPIEKSAVAKPAGVKGPRDFEPTDFLPTRPFDRDQDELQIQLMPIS